MSVPLRSIITTDTAGTIVEIECHLSNNLPTIVIVGFANRAVGESKERIRGAFASSHIRLPRKRITVNLAPADIPKADSGFDTAIAAAILLADGQIRPEAAAGRVFIGELGLDGSIRPVRGIIGKILAGRSKGLSVFYVPAANLTQAQLVPDVRLVPVESLAELHAYLSETADSHPISSGSTPLPLSHNVAAGPALSEIAGQAQAKRALEIAAAGGHNVFFNGPPGTGKSMLARTLSGLLPPLRREEMLEITQLHSLASRDYDKLVTERPLRAPHHSASLAAITGGGAPPKPGEISLAHRGVLFFDELPEFRREALEALRQPLEDRCITVVRARESAHYPADFIFVATANPCPCGYAGSNKACACLPAQVQQYQGRLSGPVLDRIDLFSTVHEIEYGRLLTQVADPPADQAVKERIAQARGRQAARFEDAGSTDADSSGQQAAHRLNAHLTNAELRRLAPLRPAAAELLNAAAQKLNLSARAYLRTVKVARTIADLENSREITETHLGEALAYRNPSMTGNTAVAART